MTKQINKQINKNKTKQIHNKQKANIQKSGDLKPTSKK